VSEMSDRPLPYAEGMEGSDRLVARSRLFVGRSGRGSQKRRPYSALRIDVRSGDSPEFVVQPLIAEWHQHQWREPQSKPFVIK
jgi:hypothetical protein